MTVYFHRYLGVMPCADPERPPTPERYRIAGLMVMDRNRWDAIKEVMPVCPRWAAPGQKLKQAARGGYHPESGEDYDGSRT